MATLMFSVPISEIELDEDGNFVGESTANLPHADLIAGRACSSWNSLGLERVINGNPVIAGGVARTPMVAKVGRDGKMSLRIKVVAADGFRLSSRRREAIREELEAQMSDGWGEGFLGEGNPMRDDSGNMFCAEVAI